MKSPWYEAVRSRFAADVAEIVRGNVPDSARSMPERHACRVCLVIFETAKELHGHMGLHSRERR